MRDDNLTLVYNVEITLVLLSSQSTYYQGVYYERSNPSLIW